MAFEELGPTFVKFGQLLATRPNLIPADFVEEFKKFHDQVAAVPFEEIRKIIEEDFGKQPEKVFAVIDPNPLAAASIAQVHSAKLVTGENVVIKVQRPGIVETIKNDLGVLYTMAALIEQYIPESRPFNPQSLVDEFFKTLELETNFVVEANNIRRIGQNFKDDLVIKIPAIFSDHCTPRILVMEQLNGVRLSDHKQLQESEINREQIVASGLKAFFKMVFRDGIFHGDLHAGNLFILPDNKIGLVDFGVVGRVSQKTKDSVANMLIALATENYELLTYEYIDLAPYNHEVNFDQFTREVRDLIAPYHGMTFKNVNFGKLLMDSTSIAAKHNIVMPSELMLFFKAIVTVEGMGRTIIKDFDLLSYAMEFAQEIIKAKYDPQRIMKDLTTVARDSTSLLYTLPRQLKQLMRKLNSNDFAIDINLAQIEDLKRSVETNGTLTYLGLVIGSLVIASTMALNMGKGPQFYEIPILSILGYFSAFFLGIVAFYNHIKK
ncbi:MAG: lipopolysaccharide core heptose(II) kinase RfaY [Oligoflexia bacterium]|nr:lipopolysaccharide core heptose(II) kinase RfaY [Oligoflexia bacterium]